jgi:hypothetical protein
MSFIESPLEGSSPSPTAIKPHPIIKGGIFLTNINILPILKKKKICHD